MLGWRNEDTIAWDGENYCDFVNSKRGLIRFI